MSAKIQINKIILDYLNALTSVITTKEELLYCISTLQALNKPEAEKFQPLPTRINKISMPIIYETEDGVQSTRMCGTGVLRLLNNSLEEVHWVKIKPAGETEATEYVPIDAYTLDRILPNNLNDLYIIHYLQMLTKRKIDSAELVDYVSTIRSRMTDTAHLFTLRKMLKGQLSCSGISMDVSCAYIDMVIDKILPEIAEAMLTMRSVLRTHYAISDIFRAILPLKNDKWAKACVDYQQFYTENFM